LILSSPELTDFYDVDDGDVFPCGAESKLCPGPPRTLKTFDADDGLNGASWNAVCGGGMA